MYTLDIEKITLVSRDPNVNGKVLFLYDFLSPQIGDTVLDHIFDSNGSDMVLHIITDDSDFMYYSKNVVSETPLDIFELNLKPHAKLKLKLK